MKESFVPLEENLLKLQKKAEQLEQDSDLFHTDNMELVLEIKKLKEERYDLELHISKL